MIKIANVLHVQIEVSVAIYQIFLDPIFAGANVLDIRFAPIGAVHAERAVEFKRCVASHRLRLCEGDQKVSRLLSSTIAKPRMRVITTEAAKTQTPKLLVTTSL